MFQFHSYILQQRELSFTHIKNLYHRTVRKMHNWMASKESPLQILSDSVAVLVSHIWFY
jgi:hypothetical protein